MKKPNNIIDRFRLKGKTAVVTGAFGKLGCVWTKALLEADAKVAALDLPGLDPSQCLKDLQKKFGPKSLRFYKSDITLKKSLLVAQKKIKKELGEVDILVNNAGIDQPPEVTKTYELKDIPSEIFSRVFDVNTLGAFLCIQVFGEGMLKRGKGSIINIASLYASVSPDARLYDHLATTDPPFLKPPAYGASKAALVNLTKYFATHWANKGVRVNAISPGGVEAGQDTKFKLKYCERTPMGRMAQLEDLEGPLLFLASDASSYVTGIELMVDGGFSVW